MNLGVVFLLLPLCFCVQVEWIAGAGATGIGVNYPASRGSESAEEFVQLLRSRGIGKIRLHDADSAMLGALGSSSGSGGKQDETAAIEVIVGVRNDEIMDVGASSASARSWVLKNVMPYHPATNIIAIAVGSEVLTSGKDGDPDTLVPLLVPAMKNIHSALVEFGLDEEIKVSAPQSAQVLSSYFPPSSAAFNGELLTGPVMAPLLEFLSISGSYFMLNLYPVDLQHHHDVGLEEKLPLDSSSSSPAGPGMDDPETGLHYSNMFDVVIDAVSVAMASLDHRLDIVVTETGWSRAGGGASAGGSSSSKLAYNAKLIDRISKGVSTPASPGVEIDTYVGGDVLLKNFKGRRSGGAAFSSRRLLMGGGVGPLETKHQPRDKSGKRRKLANKSWCVAKSDGTTEALQTALDWACGPGGADCNLLQVGQSCFLPNTIVAHASYAFNSYYQQKNWASGSCDFGGLADTTTTDPSTASCLYASNTDANGSPSTPTGSTVPSVNSRCSRLMWDRSRLILTSFILVFLLKRTISELKF